MFIAIHFFYISQSIQEWSNRVEKKLHDYHFQIALM